MGTTTPIHDALAGVLLEVPVQSITAPRAPSGDAASRSSTRGSVAEDAERVVALAWREADERGHAFFGTGHLLLGLVRADGSEAALLAAAGVTASTADAAMALVASSSVSEPVVRVRPAGCGPLAGEAVAEVLEDAGTGGEVTAGSLLTALAARPWGQAAEMLAALGVDSAELAAAVTTLAESPDTAPRPMPRDPSGLLSSAWRRPEADTAEDETGEDDTAEDETAEGDAAEDEAAEDETAEEVPVAESVAESAAESAVESAEPAAGELADA